MTTEKRPPTCPECGTRLRLYGGNMGDVTAVCGPEGDGCGYEWDTVWDGDDD